MPTSLKYKHCESSSVVYVCDSRSMKWSVVNALNSNDPLKEPMRIAQADVIRAVRRCDEEKLRGISLGEYLCVCSSSIEPVFVFIDRLTVVLNGG